MKRDIRELESNKLESFGLEFIKSQTLLILSYLSDNDINVNITDQKSESYYNNFKDGKLSNGHGFMKKYEISSYNDKIHYDNQTFAEDLQSKPIFKDLFEFLKNKGIENIGVLFHIINEMDRNVRNHSGHKDKDEKEYYFAIQHLPNANVIYFTLLDDGVGIKHNLNSLHVSTMAEGKISKKTTIATFACMNGVTSRSNHIEVHGAGRNSGYGLFMLKELGTLEGNSMKIVANGRIYKVNKETKTLQSECNIKNDAIKKITFVSAKLNLKKLDVQLKNVENNAKNMSGKSRVVALSNEDIRELFESK